MPRNRVFRSSGRYGIGAQLTKYALGAAVSLGVLLSSVEVAVDLVYEKEKTLQAVSEILDTLTPSATRAAFQLNEDLGEEVLAGLLAYRIIRKAEILDDRKQRLAGIERSSQEGTFDKVSKWCFADIASHAVALRTDGQTEPIGYLTLDLDTTVIGEGVIDRASVVLAIGVIWSGLFTFVLLFIFHLKLAKPLKTLAEKSQTTDPDARDTEFLPLPPGHERDELGTLVETINQQIERLREMQDQARQREERFKRLFENTEVSIWNEDMSDLRKALEQLRLGGVEDLRGYLKENQDAAQDMAGLVKVLQVNEATLKLFGAQNEDDFLSGIDTTFGPDALDTFIDELCAIWDKRKVFRSEATFRTLDGKDITAIISFQIPETEEGFRNIPVSVVDMTERDAIERQLVQAQKMEAVGQLTGGLAHDLNNILSIISINAGILDANQPDDPKIIRHVEATTQAVRRAGDLTRKLLDFSRTEAGEVKRVSVNEFILGMENLIAKSLTPAVSLKIALSDDIWAVDIDPGDFEAALLNLALNARDAMPDGGTLVIETANKVIDQDYVDRNPGSSVGGFVMISISDTGTGMTPEQTEKAFDPFFTTKDKGKGTGLGLSMVYGFVRRCGGHVKIYSEFGEGTTIHLYLPRAQGVGEEEDNKLFKRLDLPRGHETVLVVDDEEELAEVAVATLEFLGYRTVTTNSGKEALKILQRDSSIDLLFSDVIMPGGMDGYRLAIEAQNRRPDMKVLLTSGFAQKREEFANGEERVVSELAKNLLHKPYNIAELAAALRLTLDREG